MAKVAVKVNKDISLRLKDFASGTGLSKSKIASKAIAKYLDELEAEEDRLDAQEAEEAWLEFVASGEKTIPADEVFKEAGLI